MSRPANRLMKLRAFLSGVKDGFEQPLLVNSSTNLDHLDGDGEMDLYESQDRGVNLGQFLRAGTKSEAWNEGYHIPFIRKAGVALKD